jgi:hypothetical protein
MRKSLLLVLTLALTALTAFGQSVRMDMLVSLSYTNVRLGDALQDISNSHNVRFTYSKHYVPIDKRVNVRVIQTPLTVALDHLFEDTNVEYALIGDQIVLKKSQGAQSKLEPTFGSNDIPRRAMEQDESLTASNRIEIEELPVLEKYNLDWLEVISENPAPGKTFDPNEYYREVEQPEYEESISAQVTIVPNLGTNMENATNRTNHFSLNLLGGENGGVNGVEVGGLFNKVTNDVNGVQIAGLFNSVGGDVGPSGFISGEARRKSYGVQVAGLVNSADNVRAVQVGGMINNNRGMFKGVQVAGFGNMVGIDGEGVQLAGLFNVNGGDGGVQISGITNIANDIEGGQLSGVFNRAKNVNGMQVALINVCDSITGPTIGVLNFVRKGYNQVEVGGSETMQLQTAVRFGSYNFYNILQFGAQFRGMNDYSFGYGIGGNVPMRHPLWQWNTELLGSYVVENGQRRPGKFLGQFRFTAEYCLADRWSVYFGPTANLLTGVLSVDQIEAGMESDLPLYTLFDNLNDLNNRVDAKIWFGFRAGIRFGRNHK